MHEEDHANQCNCAKPPVAMQYADCFAETRMGRTVSCRYRKLAGSPVTPVSSSFQISEATEDYLPACVLQSEWANLCAENQMALEVIEVLLEYRNSWVYELIVGL